MKPFTGIKFGVNFYNFSHPIDKRLCEYLSYHHYKCTYRIGEHVIVKKHLLRDGFIVDCAFTTRFDEKTGQTSFVMTYKVALLNRHRCKKRHCYYHKWFAEYHLENAMKFYKKYMDSLKPFTGIKITC